MSRWPVRISQTGGGPPPPPPSSQDRFAPKYLVGNTDNGDSAVAYNTAGFRYIPDSGNGAGIALALSAALANPGDIWIRPGQYDLGKAGAPTVPLAIPKSVRVQGAGGNLQGVSPISTAGTAIIAKSGTLQAEDQSVFTLDTQSQLENICIYVPPYKWASGIGSTFVIGVQGGGCVLRNIEVVADINDGMSPALRNLISIDAPGNKGLPVSLENITLVNEGKKSETFSDNSLVLLLRGLVSCRNLRAIGGATGIEVSNSISSNGESCEFRGDDIFISQSKLYGVYYHPNTSPAGSVKIHRSRIGPILTDSGLGGGFGVFFDGGDGHTLSDCFVSGFDGVFVVAPSPPNEISDVVISGCEISATRTGVTISNSGGGTVSRVSVTDCSVLLETPNDTVDRYAVIVQGATDVTIESNAISIVGDAS